MNLEDRRRHSELLRGHVAGPYSVRRPCRKNLKHKMKFYKRGEKGVHIFICETCRGAYYVYLWGVPRP